MTPRSTRKTGTTIALLTLAFVWGIFPLSRVATAYQAVPTQLQQQLILKTGKVQIVLGDGTKVTIDSTTTPPTANSLSPNAAADARPSPILLPASAPLAITLDATTGLPLATVSSGQTFNTNIAGGGAAELNTTVPAINDKTVTIVTTISPGTVAIEQQADTNPDSGKTNFRLFTPIGTLTMDVPATGLLTVNVEIATPLGSIKSETQNGANSVAQVEMPSTGISVSAVAVSGSLLVKTINGQTTTIDTSTVAQAARSKSVAVAVKPTGGNTSFPARLLVAQATGSNFSVILSASDIAQLQSGGLAALLPILQKNLVGSLLSADLISALQKVSTTPITESVIPQLEVLNTIYGRLVSGNPSPEQLQFVQEVTVTSTQCASPAASGVGGVACS